MNKRRFVVIGGDAAGMSAASLAKRRMPDLEIEAYEMGDFTSYGACGMPYYVSGEVGKLEDLVVVTPEEFREKRGINVFMRHRVEKINPSAKTIEVRNLETDEHKEAGFDDLLIATGAEPVIPPGLDINLPGVYHLRTLHDADGIKKYIQENSIKEGLVVGTGYIGMEMAEALAQAGLDVTVVGRRPKVMPLFEDEIRDEVEKELLRKNVNLISGVEAAGVERQGSRLLLSLSDGRTISTDLIVVGAGVKPRSSLAVEAGIKVGVKKAVSVDRNQRTSHDNIWSAGDCCEVYHSLLTRNAYIPLALGANRQGRIVGHNISGSPVEFPGVLGTTICKVFDLTVARTGLGLKEARDEGFDAVTIDITSRSRPHYYPGSAPIKTVLVVERGSRKLWGAQMTGVDGVAHRINTWATALAAGMSLEQIHGLDLAYAPPYSPVWDPVLISSEIAMKKLK